MQQLSLFRGVHDTQPRPVTLEELVTMMRTDQSVRDLTEKHRYARSAGDEQGASRYKKMMASFGVAARFEGGRQQKHIVEFTGLSLVDIDHIAEEDMVRVLDLVRADEHTLLAYTTLSGQGLRILARYEASPNPSQGGELAESEMSESPLLDFGPFGRRPKGWEGRGEAPFVELTDDHVNSLYCRFCLSTGLTTRPKEFNTIIESDFYPTYNPLHEYLESLPTWDGVTDHIDQLASTVHVTGCTQEMHNRFFKKWMVAMVAAWMDETVTNHEILTYIGPQGRYKTTFMTRLLPPALGEYFATKTFKGRMDKDDRLALTELALIDLEELDVMNASEVNQLKALVTDPSVNLRPVYARYSVRRAHIASFCGTGNNPRFLTDLTGHRRWLPFMIEAIDSPYEHPFDYEGIYAQAYALYREGFRYWFTDEENAELEQHNRQFEEPCIEEELIRTYLCQPYGEEKGEFLTATRIIELVGTSVRVSLSPKRIAMAMQRLGYEQRRVMNTRGWNVVILTGDQIKEQQRMDAHRSSVE